jgi:hypothetical protein
MENSTENNSVDASLILDDKNISCETNTIDKEVCEHHHDHHHSTKQDNETHDPTLPSKETIFRMYSTSSSLGYAAGEMVTFSYGRRDNSHLLMEYGFVIGENEHETLILSKPPIQTLSTVAKEILTSEQYVCGPFNLVFGRIDGHLLSFFRAIALSQDTEYYKKWSRGTIRSLNHPFSSKGEQCALALYSNYLTDFLTTAFPTTIEQDEAMLKKLLTQTLSSKFRPEFLNRFDDIVVFHPLTRDHISSITFLILDEVDELHIINQELIDFCKIIEKRTL